MITKKDAKIIAHLRNNARKKITRISKDIDVPVTTIYDKIRVHNQKFVQRYASLLDFPKLGLHAKALVSIKVDANARDELQRYLLDHPNVNSLSRIGYAYDLLAEVVFNDAGEIKDFTENIEQKFGISEIQVLNVIDELKKEAFLTKPEHIEVIRQ